MSKFYFSFDVGGTSIKAGIVSKDGVILASKSVPTKKSLKTNSLASTIVTLSNEILSENNLRLSDALGIGVGLPGLVDTKNGVLKFSGNLGLKDYKIAEELKSLINLPVKVANDADISTLAELYAGAGKDFSSFIMLTVGTGIGGGLVLDGHLIASDYSGEIGHMKVAGENALKCTCGECGCYETIASTSALVSQTADAMRKNPDSKMWEKYTPETVTGKTVFEFSNDKTAKQVLKQFIQNLGDGIVSLVNVFKPDAIIIGGAISNQKEKLLFPLEEYVNKHIFARRAGFSVKILPAKETGESGILGARFLF